MTESYKKKLLELSKELLEQVDSENNEALDTVPILLSQKIYYICGYIEALEDKNDHTKLHN